MNIAFPAWHRVSECGDYYEDQDNTMETADRVSLFNDNMFLWIDSPGSIPFRPWEKAFDSCPFGHGSIGL